jgi:hypothetical protein
MTAAHIALAWYGFGFFFALFCDSIAMRSPAHREQLEKACVDTNTLGIVRTISVCACGVMGPLVLPLFFLIARAKKP